jgi:hypothetical protein
MLEAMPKIRFLPLIRAPLWCGKQRLLWTRWCTPATSERGVQTRRPHVEALGFT